MSKGIGAFAKLLSEDDVDIIYEYSSYNLNEPKYRNMTHICDGHITIKRKCFTEPEIHRKIKKMPNGKKKLITKRILIYVDYNKMIDDGLIEVKNCTNCWEENDKHIDVMALHILFYIFHEYQKGSKIPTSISYNV